ncbi:Transthyretin-like family protein [Oesophagostomum dentatum]|uniref:Transthyretin-like family protein n=1 Tax=Oesophagostomum dentatum TaxID=61180 RepID=A0A0B1SQN1_OESDE|nr:Transthyretin-like family protein [Oesophagostomum dentatum]
MLSSYIALLLIPSSFALLGIGSQQSVAVTGQLLCNGQPASGIRIKLYDDDLTVDSKMDEQYTNNAGVFTVSGSSREVTSIDPKINIYHKCNYYMLCYRKLSISIPSNYVSYGSTARTTYNVGTINLNNQFSGETIDCLN